MGDRRFPNGIGQKKMADGYPLPQFNPDPLESPIAKKILADYRKQQAAAQRLTPLSQVTDTLGKLSAARLTAAGMVAGAANVAAARMAGDKRARISMRDNGIQFESGYLGDENRAFTLGNAVIHGPGSRPGDRNDRYDWKPTNATTAEHESGHTYQYQHPGFVPDYVRYLVREYLTGKPNPYEREADDFGDWKSRQRNGRP